MKVILLSFILLLSCLATAQTSDYQHQKDSLLKVIAGAEGEAKLDAYYDLTALLFYYEQQTDTVLYYFDKYINEALKQGNVKIAGRAKKNTISKLSNDSKYQQVIEKADDALDFLAKNDLWDYYYDVYRSLIEAYFFIGKNEIAIEKGKQMYEQAKRLNHSNGVQTALVCIGIIYSNTFRDKEAEDVFRQCLEEADKIGEVSDIKISCYFNLANLKNKQHQTEGAEELFNRWEKDIEKLEKQGENMFLPRHDFNRIKLSFYCETKNWEKVEEYCNLLDNSNHVKDNTQITVYNAKIQMYIAREEWAKALTCVDAVYEIADRGGSLQNKAVFLRYKIDILYHLGQAEEGLSTLYRFERTKDSIANLDFAAHIDELRTRYEVDKITAEKERNRNYFLFALAGCALLLVLLAIWIYYNHQITGKNRALAQRIRELTVQQELRDVELLNKTSFIKEDIQDDDFCPESRMDKLCVAIRDLILRDKAYRNPTISRDYVIERLGTNRELFVDAFMYCFGMSFTEYINSLRLKDAVTLLEQSDMSIENISEKTGFGTLRTFQRQFQTKYNMSPKNYRNSAKSS